MIRLVRDRRDAGDVVKEIVDNAVKKSDTKNGFGVVEIVVDFDDFIENNEGEVTFHAWQQHGAIVSAVWRSLG